MLIKIFITIYRNFSLSGIPACANRLRQSYAGQEASASVVTAYRLTILFVVLFVFNLLPAQRYLPADPRDVLTWERDYFYNGIDHGSLLIRPLWKPYSKNGSNWAFKFSTEGFMNTGAPNLENTSDRWVGPGLSFFSSYNISYSGKFLAFSLEPFYFINQNREYDEPQRTGKFSKLNDMRAHKETPYVAKGFRESQLYLHSKGIGLGISNANMWWGPGIHSTLNMTNNTTGFQHLMIGTLRDKRWRNLSFNARYIFSDSTWMAGNAAKPFYTATVFSATLHSDPILTVGLSRTYLSGGNRTDQTITRKEAMLLPLETLFLKDKQTDPDDPTSSLDIWDQTLSGYVMADFPKSGLRIFVEYGRNDHAWDKIDFRRQPDHTTASVIGLRKVGLFGKENLIAGLEYANLIRYKYWHQREGADWYDRKEYNYWSYNGRMWGAHSGSDSDDLLVYIGIDNGSFSIIPAINYERHGIVSGNYEMLYETYPESKFEFRINMLYQLSNIRVSIYYEREFVDNAEFRGAERQGSMFLFGVEKGIGF